MCGRGCREIAGVDGIHDLAVRSRGDVGSDTDQAGCTNRQMRQHVRVVAGEVQQVGVVEHTADLAEVALRIFDGPDVGVLRRTDDRFVPDRDARATGNVVEDDRQVCGVGDHPEVSEHTGLGGLVVVGGHDHDGVSPGLRARLVQLDRVGRLVGTATHDDLRAPGRDTLRHLDESQLLGVGEGGCLTRRSRDDDAVSTGPDHVVDVLLDVGPVDLPLRRERRDESDEHLSERVVYSHVYRLSGVCSSVGQETVVEPFA